jgi:N-acetylglutamate synthase-like GNAT family acetyltransferase
MTALTEVRTPRTAQEWQRYYELRWAVLRSPWGVDGPEREEDEDRSIHRLLIAGDGEVLAVGRLHRLDEQTGQIRFMAVAPGQERKGYGSRLLQSLETAAHDIALDTVILQARENARPFYEHHGYELVEKTFLLFDAIQHYLMRKKLET